MLIIDHSQSAQHLLPLPSARHQNDLTPQPLLLTCPGSSPEMQKHLWDPSSELNPRCHWRAHIICTTHLCKLTGNDFQAEISTSDLTSRFSRSDLACQENHSLPLLAWQPLHGSCFATAGKVRLALT